MRIGISCAQRVELMWGSRSADAIKFRVTSTSLLPVLTTKVILIKNDLLVSKSCAVYLAKDNEQETIDMRMITERRSVLRTIALTSATGAIGIASAAVKPAAAAAQSELTLAGATILYALMKRLA